MKGSAYTIGFAAVLGTVCALLLTAAAGFTKKYREANQEAEEAVNILLALKVPLQEKVTSKQVVDALEGPDQALDLDPCDLGDGILTLRMAEFPDGRPNDDLAAKSRVVPLSRLRDELPAETKWVTAGERARQLAERAAGYKRRLPES